MGHFNSAVWNKAYSRLFLLVVFISLFSQIFGPNLKMDSISDHFLLRMALIRGFNRFRYAVGDRVFNEGLVGREGWLFYSGDFSIHDYQKTAPIGKKDLNELRDILTLLDETARRNGGTLLVVIPPDKNTIYSQYMPSQIPVIGQLSRLDQFLEYMQNNTGVQVMDLRPALIDASQSSQIYYQLDAHWNCLGAFYASNEIVSNIAVSPPLRPRPLSDFEIGTIMDSTLDISGTMGFGFQEMTPTLTPKVKTSLDIQQVLFKKDGLMRLSVNPQADLPDALILHDSFYNECLNQFLEPYFSRTFSTHYATAALSDYVTWIDREKPDVVIVEFAERHIEYFLRLLNPKGQ
jgi:alginate O-acetyltransferase complex protein AlgJ